MAKAKDKNSGNDIPALNKRIETMMGPPPRSIKAKNDKSGEPEPLPPAPPAEPVEEPVEDDEPKERLLVIPPSDKSDAEVQKMAAPSAGDTIEPDKSKDSAADAVAKAKAEAKKVKSGRMLGKIWHNRVARKLILLIVALAAIGAIVNPGSRYFMLNNVGVRSSASLTVLDDSTQLPLKNVEVSIGGQSIKTDANGEAKLFHIKLGNQKLTIEKRAFAPIEKDLVIGWGSNPLGNYNVDPTGSQYAIFVKDWLTGKTITEASASGGGADAVADPKGKILLTIDTSIAQLNSLEVTVKADGYRDETFMLDLASKATHTARMVTSHKDAYISNKSGKFDVYTVDVDGKNTKLALAGTGLERDDLVLVQHPTDNVAALVSTRVNARNNEGYLLSTLTLINLKDNNTQAVAQSEQVQLVGWIGDRLIFVQIAAGASASDPNRFKLMSYDYKTNDKKQIDSANLFNDVMLNGNLIYYAPSANYQKDPKSGLIQSNADGSKKVNLLDNEVWNIFRINFDTLNLATAKDWYEYKINSTEKPVKLIHPPSNPKNRLYITSDDGKHSLWVDQRDGKGLLINYDTEKQTETTLVTTGGLAYPVKWLTNTTLVYRLATDQETADYVLDITGGKPHKITDLYNAPGINRWYFY